MSVTFLPVKRRSDMQRREEAVRIFSQRNMYRTVITELPEDYQQLVELLVTVAIYHGWDSK